ncbi:MAG: N-acetylmuramoyl-L-alanine amidase [Sphingomonadales bacterium]|nr:N-acetylmuramoyl-L-alanine amidase [Sphingomonadales bacterium]
MLVGSLIMAAATLLPTSAQAGGIRSVAADGAAVVVEFDDIVSKASVFALSGPDRIAVDIEGATVGQNEMLAGAFRQVRQGQFNSDTARLVFDLDQPVVVTGGSFAADGRSLRLNVVPASGDEFVRSMASMRKEIVPPAAFRSQPPKGRYEVSAPIGKGVARGLPKIHGPADSRLPLVLIDAGHGGHDPGAISPHGGMREKDITLSIARSIRDELVKSGRIRVALTRDTDRFLVLQDRYGIARKMKADLFISIHADSAENQTARGGSVYTLSEVASDREAQRLASRENKSDIINGVNLGGTNAEVSSVLIDLTQRETMNVSANFAKLLMREAKPNLTLRRTAHRSASFIVLKAPDTPSVLFETGYLSNAEDAAFLSSGSGQRKVGQSVSSAVQAHFAKRLAKR